MKTPAFLFIGALVLCALFIGVTLFTPKAPEAPALPTEASVREALARARIDVSEFGEGWLRSFLEKQPFLRHPTTLHHKGSYA